MFFLEGLELGKLQLDYGYRNHGGCGWVALHFALTHSFFSEDFPDVLAFVMIGDPHAEQPTDSENNETATQKLLPVRFL